MADSPPDAVAPDETYSARRTFLPSHRVLFASPHAIPVLILVALTLLYWSHVLFLGQALLPGEFLRGFPPFGTDPRAPWNILQWDALSQYYPWRHFAAHQLRDGLIPLWNPHQFAGTPFLANGQSAVFYPLNLPFWTLDVAYAFGVSAALHTLLACLGTYALAQRWNLSRAASLLAAVTFGFCGYLSTWVMLPTLSNTASWLPLLILLLERAMPGVGDRGLKSDNSATRLLPLAPRLIPLALALCCAVLAGHAQIFFYCLVALVLRALTLPQRGKALVVLLLSATFALALSALQILPTLELARLGHRAAQGGATMAGWNFVRERALQLSDWPLLFVSSWSAPSFSENFGYVGPSVLLLALAGLVSVLWYLPRKRTTTSSTLPAFQASPLLFSVVLTVFGLAYALATPLAQLFYFWVPGLPQMGGTGRALVLWSLGMAMLTAFGLDFLRAQWKAARGSTFAAIALFTVTLQLFFENWNLQPTAPRGQIYPPTAVTTFLRNATRDGSRVLFLTPRQFWLPVEGLQPARNHPPGVLPPNGATVYGLYDVNGYDSLALRAYRQFVTQREGTDVSPPFNGNMILLENLQSPALDALGVRYIVTLEPQPTTVGRKVLESDGCFVYERSVANVPQVNGRDFAPGWRDGRYQPESFRCGLFVSLCALAIASCCAFHVRRNRT
jgi:hypothetical protein